MTRLFSVFLVSAPLRKLPRLLVDQIRMLLVRISPILRYAQVEMLRVK